MMSFIRHILLAIGVGCGATLWYMQKDVRVKTYIGNEFKRMFQSSLDCIIEGSVSEVNFFSPTIILENVHVYNPNDRGWMWSAQKYTISFSWWSFLFYRTIDMYMSFDHFLLGAEIEKGDFSLLRHLRKMITSLPAVGIALNVKSLEMKHAACEIRDHDRDLVYALAWTSHTKRMAGVFKSSLHLLSGSTTYKNTKYVDDITGTIHLDAYSTHIKSDIDIASNIVLFPQHMQRTYVRGVWSGTEGSLLVQNASDQLTIEIKDLVRDADAWKAHMHIAAPIGTLYAAIYEGDVSILHGDLAVTTILSGTQDGYEVDGSLSLERLTYQDTAIGNLHIAGNRKRGEWRGAYELLTALGTVQGTVHLDEATQKGVCEGKRVTSSPTQTMFLPEQFSCTYAYDAQPTVTCEMHTRTPWHTGIVPLKGALTLENNRIILQGDLAGDPYECVLQKNPLKLLSGVYKNRHGVRLLEVHASSNDTTNIMCSTLFLRALAERQIQQSVQAEGACAITITKKHDAYHAQLSLVDGLVRVPYTYNVVHQGVLEIIWYPLAKKIIIDNGKLTFHEGEVTLKHGVCMYDDAYAWKFIHVPLTANTVLLNVGKEFFATISGYMLCTLSDKRPFHVLSSIIIDKAHLKENVFSADFQRKMANYSARPFSSADHTVLCDITVASRVPIKIKTPFLETAARAHLVVSQSIEHPQITGSIELESGFLAFPYKPLYISKGALYFMPNQLYDPLIELVAKNQIKKYHIGLQVTGSLKNHHMLFESSPSLTDEQIMALLLVGTEDESLNIVMPALIMQNLQTLLFGYDQSPSALNKIFANILQPFDKIHVVPRFSDQTGRGGLRGTIEIEVNDQWRALIQKNFNLTEDTRFEVEYSVSDEITVRGVRDERRDLGAEVEMRWKF